MRVMVIDNFFRFFVFFQKISLAGKRKNEQAEW